MRFTRLAGVPRQACSCLRRVVFFHRGQTQENGGRDGCRPATTPRVTVALITHAVPGDTFWDLIRKGAQAAADKDNIELRYSNDPRRRTRPTWCKRAIDSGVKGIAVDVGQARRDGARRQGRGWTKAYPSSRFNSGFDNWKAMGVQEYFGQDEKLAGESLRRTAQQGRRQERSASSRSRARSRSNPGVPV